jgi:hypothetical protein
MCNFWSPDPQRCPHLTLAIRAVSLAYLSTIHKSAEISQQARKRYVSALSLTSAVIRCPKARKGNDVLMTVIMLDLFENFALQLQELAVDKNPSDTLRGIDRHIQGALALVQLAGREQREDDIWKKMFGCLYARIEKQCHRTGAEIPGVWMEIRRSVDSDGIVLETTEPC